VEGDAIGDKALVEMVDEGSQAWYTYLRELKPVNRVLSSCATAYKSTTIQNVLVGLRKY
jgi:hypothetical protein